MPFVVKSYALQSEETPLALHELERRDVLPDDVLIDILYAGVCHSDLHQARDWPNRFFPMVPGHEIVGKVEAVGKDVKKVKVGDIVAVGCIVDSCLDCEQCDAGYEMFCYNGMTDTYSCPEPRFPGHSTAGGYSQKIVVPEHFALQVPKDLQKPELLSGVAPILCAGITTYSPLRRYGVTKGTTVGVLGLGGLGHMAVKLAKAMGAEVGVVSRSHKKDAQAKALGADFVVSSSNPEELEKYKNKFDLVLDTIAYDHDVAVYFPMVKPLGTLCVLGHIGPFGKQFDTNNIVPANKNLSGSNIGGIKETQELLDLCAKQAIIADHQVIPIEQINEAWEHMSRGDVANRYVIDIQKFI